MIQTLQDIRRQNLKKATQVRQDGHKTSIHALPPKIKERLDQLLTHRLSAINVLRSINNEFPGIELPSPKAVESYRTKYHTQALTRQRALRNNQLYTDFQKLQVKSFILENAVPQLLKRINNSLEIENKVGMPLKATNDAVRGLTRLLTQLQ